MIELFDSNDSCAVRNKDNILGFYDLVINKKKPEEFVARFISPAYIQHNPPHRGRSRRAGEVLRPDHPERAQARVRRPQDHRRLATMCGLT